MQNHILPTEIILLHQYFVINLILPTNSLQSCGMYTPPQPLHATPPKEGYLLLVFVKPNVMGRKLLFLVKAKVFPSIQSILYD